MIETLAFDADDTLWENLHFYEETERQVARLLSPWCGEGTFAKRLFEAESRNIGLYGYGIKGYTLSMIEVALDVSDGKVDSKTISSVLAAGRAMLRHPVHLIDGVEEILEALAPHYRMIVITKGDLFDQERKLEESGLIECFDRVEIVAEKTVSAYRRIAHLHDIDVDTMMMIGNSLKSDIQPVLELGAHAAFIPHAITWDLEHADIAEGTARFHQLETVRQVPDLLQRLNGMAAV